MTSTTIHHDQPLDLCHQIKALPARPGPAVRWELVQRIRRELAAGGYETPEKWAVVLDRLVAELAA